MSSASNFLLTILPFQSIESTAKYFKFCLETAGNCKPSKTLSAPYLLQVCLSSPYFCEINRDRVFFSTFHENDPILNMLKLLTEKLVTKLKDENNSYEHKVYHGLISSLRHLLQIRDVR